MDIKNIVTFKMKSQFLLILIVTILFSCNNTEKTKFDEVSILSTDLSLDKDPDDWFDVFVFLTTKGIHPKGIVLDYYATDTVYEKLKLFLKILNIRDIEIKKGLRHDALCSDIDDNEGVNFILQTMKETNGKVNLIAVGTLRNEALAYKSEPDLFKSKVKQIYFAGGTLDGTREVNVIRGVDAVKTLFNSDIPIVWIPCTSEMKQRLSPEQELLIRTHQTELTVFFSDLLNVWREDKGEKWLKKTNQSAGKNLWSLPAFIHLADLKGFDLQFERGNVFFEDSLGPKFKSNKNGKDLLLINRSEEKITNWVTNSIINFNQTN
jgi:hypothetical protein